MRRSNGSSAKGSPLARSCRCPPELVRESVAGILVRTLTTYSGGRGRVPDDLGDEIASFVLRALLVDPSTLSSVRGDGARAR
jgi:hypothetical protein